jgi:hypothetical protein
MSTLGDRTMFYLCESGQEKRHLRISTRIWKNGRTEHSVQEHVFLEPPLLFRGTVEESSVSLHWKILYHLRGPED